MEMVQGKAEAQKAEGRGEIREENSPAFFMFKNEESQKPEVLRSSILKLESAMLAMPEHHVELKVTHHFSPGVYMREIFIPKGVTLVGKIHKSEQLNILSQGKLAVFTEEGRKVVTASTVILSPAGVKRVGHALEDSIWITVHGNLDNEKNLDILEERYVASTYEEFLSYTEKAQISEGS